MIAGYDNFFMVAFLRGYLECYEDINERSSLGL